ncbi:MAG: Dabb family protein [Geobacter sp.]|nr:Dabb family protein [Geobacter sp.]
MIAHIVLFKLKDPTESNITAVKEMLLSMNGKLPMLRHLEAGADVIRSERSYDVALYTKFDNLADLQAYQIHPYHADTVVPLMKASCSAIVAADYEI